MGTIRFAGLVFGVMLVSMAGATTAHGSSCPSDQSVMSYSKNDPPYQCALHNWSSKKSIGAWATKSWSSETAFGYTMLTKCSYRSSKSDVSWVWSTYGPSYSATFTNWATSTRHFGTGVIFTTGSVDSSEYKSSSDCGTGDGKIKNSIKRITQKVEITSVTGSMVAGGQLTINGTVSPSDATGYIVLMLDGAPAVDGDTPVGAMTSGGKFTILWTTPSNASTTTYNLAAAYQGDVSNCPAEAKSCGFTPGQSKAVPVTVGGDETAAAPLSASAKSSGDAADGGSTLLTRKFGSELAGISSSVDPGIRVTTKSAKMPAKLSAGCPKGTVQFHAELFGADTGRSLSYGKRGVELKSGAVGKGRRAAIQITCRDEDRPMSSAKGIVYGTSKADGLKTGAERSTLLGGPGRDRLLVRHDAGIANGGLGNDWITILGGNGIALGGPGHDRIIARTPGKTLLIGGPGKDRIDASGEARIDARDGRRDTVICRGNQVRVKADPIDRLIGNCIRS
jgi:hypothetical protein